MEKMGSILSMLLVALVIVIILAAGPVKAVSLNINFDDPLKEYIQGETVTFTLNVEINDPDVQLPISELTLDVNGASPKSCNFMADGSNSCGAEWNLVSATGYEAYGFGNNTVYNEGNQYDFGYGYGYGYNELNTILHYVIELDTNSMDAGSYDAVLKIDTGNAVIFDQQESFEIIEQFGTVINVNSPLQDGNYDERRVLVDIDVSEMVDELQYSDDGEKYSRLCRDCDSVSKLIPFRDGATSLIIKAIKENEQAEKTVEFNVDTQLPRIIETEPSDIAGGEFKVRYNENDLRNVEWYYDGNMVELNNCESGRNKECSVNVDLSSYDGQEIEYYFKIYDAINSDQSDTKQVFVEASAAVINIVSPMENVEYSNNRLPVMIALNKEVESLEYSLNGDNFRNLCTRCSEYNRDKIFEEGTNQLLVRAIDYAGNVNEESTEFIVDSKEPVVIETLPGQGDYVNSQFSIKYTEDNVERIKLYYGQGNNFNNVELNNCESGRNKECSVNVDLSSYEGTLFYYFTIEDPTHLVTSDLVSFNVDYDDPILNVYSPIEFSYNEKIIPISLNVNENVDVQYSIDGGRFLTLCRDCTDYDRRRTFSYGEHEIIFKAIDYAGNYDEKTVDFEVLNS